jgi:MFS family permease
LSKPVKDKVYTTQFWMVCCSSLLFFASFNMIIPELPAYLTNMGGADYKGLIISLFTITALISRPFSGKLADKVGRVPVVMAGSVVCLICSLIYPIVSTVTAFLWLRLVHGFSTGFTPTGQTAFLSDIIPPEKRGEAMGLLGTAGTVGMAAGPALGGNLSNHFGIDAVFYCSSMLALVSVVIVFNVKETLLKKHRFSLGLLKIKKVDLFEPKVLAPCLVMVLCAYSYGAAFTLIPDFGEYTGIRNKGLLFTYFTIASLAVRLIGGKMSDRYGRKRVLLFSTMLMCMATLVIAFAEMRLQLIIGIVMYGFSQGITSPTLLAWATDLSDIKYKGRGLASLYIFMELGIGIGAFASGFIYANKSDNFFVTFAICSALALMSFFYLLTVRSRTNIS